MFIEVKPSDSFDPAEAEEAAGIVGRLLQKHVQERIARDRLDEDAAIRFAARTAEIVGTGLFASTVATGATIDQAARCCRVMLEAARAAELRAAG